MHLIPQDDERFPWVVQACLMPGVSMENAMDTPHRTGQQDASLEWSLEVDDVPDGPYYDFQQVCALACGTFQSDSRIGSVLVRNDNSDVVYHLTRTPTE